MSPGELPADAAEADLLVVGGPTHMHTVATARSRRAALDAQRGTSVGGRRAGSA